MAALCLLVPPLVLAQDSAQPIAAAGTATTENRKQEPASDIIIEGLASYGHYKIFASGEDYHLYTGGVEYDRHSWGDFLGAQVDYTALFLPVFLLNTSDVTDIWGDSLSANRKLVPGVGIYPIGFRMRWLNRKSVRPYFSAVGGMLGFTQKVLSSKATYEDFSLQYGTGLLVKVNPRIDLRLGLFSDVHFSNGFITPINPGLDVMSSSFGVSYRLGQPAAR